MKSLGRIFVVGFTLLLLVFGGVVYAADEAGGDNLVSHAMTVNINAADAELIAEVLNGIGLKKAHAIVAWREKHGKFTSIQQLAEIKGIGEATLAKNANMITLN